MWNDLPYTVFDTGTLNVFKEISQPLVASLFFSVFRGAGAYGVAKEICKHYFPAWASAAGLYNNNTFPTIICRISVILESRSKS